MHNVWLFKLSVRNVLFVQYMNDTFMVIFLSFALGSVGPGRGLVVMDPDSMIIYFLYNTCPETTQYSKSKDLKSILSFLLLHCLIGKS